MEILYGLGSWLWHSTLGSCLGMGIFGVCMAIKESWQGINTAFLPLDGAADGVLG